jgi:hypothetical protein
MVCFRNLCFWNRGVKVQSYDTGFCKNSKLWPREQKIHDIVNNALKQSYTDRVRKGMFGLNINSHTSYYGKKIEVSFDVTELAKSFNLKEKRELIFLRDLFLDSLDAKFALREFYEIENEGKLNERIEAHFLKRTFPLKS